MDESGDALWGGRLDPTPDDAADGARALSPSLAVAADGGAVVLFGRALADPSSSTLVFALATQVFDAAGQRLAHTPVGTAGDSWARLALAADGDLFVTGTLRDTLELGEVELLAPSDSDGYLARLSPAGEVRWIKTFGAPTSFQIATHLAVASGSRPIVGGQYRGSFAIGDDDMPLANDNPLAFVVAFAP